VTPEQFCYWLQGRAEMQPDNPPSAEEWKIIAEHLQLVFRKETGVKKDMPKTDKSDSIKKTIIPNTWPEPHQFDKYRLGPLTGDPISPLPTVIC
jgi:hypothetical protein